MPTENMSIEHIGNAVYLKRDQWGDKRACISDYPGLLDEVQRYTWTLKTGNHPYLWCGKLNTSLHKFVLSYIYGGDKLDNMLANDNIIEHLDNDGLNCSYDNLHIISSDYNKAKAFTIDKKLNSYKNIPSYVTDVYYSHEKQVYQMQVFFNRDIYFEQQSGIPIQSFYFQYDAFPYLYIDWLYLLESLEKSEFDIKTIHAQKVFAEKRPLINLEENEKDHVIIERDGHLYLRLNPDGGDKAAFMVKTVYKDLGE